MNWSSNKQLKELLYNKLKLPIVLMTPKNEPSTGVKALRELKGKHPIIDLLLKYRKLTKLLTTYTETLITKVNIITEKLHPEFKQTGTETGRLSSENPNGQQIPKHTEEGKMIRKAFKAEESNLFYSFDYSQIELRVLAHYSQDTNLSNAFKKGDDIHQAVADELGIERQTAKAINFGLVYGSTEYGLARTLNIKPEEAKQYIDKYFQRYKGVYYWMRQQKQLARKQGYVTTFLGRKRTIDNINSSDRKLRYSAERQALNTTIQGSAADIMKVAMIKVKRMLDFLDNKVRFILQIHDDLVIECLEKTPNETIYQIKKEMETAIELSIPLVVNISSGKTLGDL